MEEGTMLIIVTAALAVSEALALIPGLKANSIFQLVVGILRAIGGRK